MQLSPKQARKLVLLMQGLHQGKKWGSGVKATMLAIEQLGYVQIDTISVVERAHHHTLWSRVNGYKIKHLDTLLENRQIFEYWSHAAAYLPINDFRYSLRRKHAIKTAIERHWHEPNPQTMSYVLKRIEAEGPLSSKDFTDPKQSSNSAGWGNWKPTKVALEQLFMEGDLMVSKRQGFQKVFDLTERVLPVGINTKMPSEVEFQRHLITRYLRANGLGTPEQISYLRKGVKREIQARCTEMLEDGELINVTVKQPRSASLQYYALPNALEQLSRPLSQRRLAILSPFDNLVIQRKRTLELFAFDYQIECYLPKSKRQYGYFCLPLLWGQQFVGRMDAKIDRKRGALHIISLHLETDKKEQLKHALTQSLDDFLLFNRGSEIIF